MTGIDVDEWAVEDCFLDVNLHPLAGAERRRAAHMVSRVPISRFRRAGLNRLAAAYAGELLDRYLSVAMHYANERFLGLIFKDNRLQYGMMIYSKLSGGLDCTAVKREVVGFKPEHSLRSLERTDCHCHRYVIFFWFHGTKKTVVGLAGIGPATPTLKVSCSTN